MNSKVLTRNFFLVVLLSIFFAFDWAPFELPKSISDAVKTGNSAQLAKHFFDNIEVIISGKENIYSRTQAERILNEFFSKNQPKDFVILHQGGKNASQFAIGRLSTNNGTYRFTMFMKTEGEKQLIHQLRIENEIE
ncbi:MAG TPA: hypothetical protein DCQ31_12580 [Bacteroidales bacterium]|nr:hypothetical protein [Bacteroidales bacterium]